MSDVFPPEAILQTEYGKFHLKINKYIGRNSGIIESYTISIGSERNKCVQITIPSREMIKNKGNIIYTVATQDYNTERDAYLIWVESNDKCTMEQYIERGLSQHMVLLGLTLVKDINPLIKRVYLKDTSSFDCELPGRSVKVSMKDFHLAFYESTWYEYYFNAKLVHNYDVYTSLKSGFKDPGKKPERFYFGSNAELVDKIINIYERAVTWRDMFDLVSAEFGKRKCGAIYIWIKDALSLIFDRNMIFEDINWYIELDGNSRLEPVKFKAYSVKRSGGGKRRTAKNKKIVYESQVQYTPDMNIYNSMDFKRFLEMR
jgi:hypothetical protein